MKPKVGTWRRYGHTFLWARRKRIGAWLCVSVGITLYAPSLMSFSALRPFLGARGILEFIGGTQPLNPGKCRRKWYTRKLVKALINVRRNNQELVISSTRSVA